MIRAWPHRHEVVELVLAPGACVRDAVAAAGWAGEADVAGFAVFGAKADPAAVLAEGDRVEVLRALTVDPKVARRKRAEARPAGKR
ncbi:hypothetical protein IP93_01069 [Lysobacter ruishenii]|uniref:Uncharacterized protein n=1 Tax=Aerolutibacter ruishenii TaxID=686800 RepID=A0A562LYU4_9GAMM|nr:hypothetical protein IP93_01069 [Lysobacter ruishenii]